MRTENTTEEYFMSVYVKVSMYCDIYRLKTAHTQSDGTA